MKAWAGWNTDGMVFAFDVKDDVHIQSNADETIWHGDHIELQFDIDLEGDYDNPGMNKDDYQIGLSIGDREKGVPMISYAWFNGPFSPGPVEGIQMAYQVTDVGYILEAFIPAAALSNIDLRDGGILGMNVSISDSDKAGAGQTVMLSTSKVRTYADPRTFGKITLIK